MAERDVYAAPRRVEEIGDCAFYHTMEIPGHGVVQGDWDLRGGVDEYLGGVDFRGKRVLEMGTANGFLCFEMERRGAEVVACDLSDAQPWDVVPYSGFDHRAFLAERRDAIRRINNGYWFAHRALGSRARVVYATAYDVPEAIGEVDVVVFGSILLHLRDPFLALQRVLPLTRETVIVCDRPPRRRVRTRKPAMLFLPDWRKQEPKEGWWRIPEETVAAFVGVLGFTDAKITRHRQRYQGKKTALYTLVARRRPDGGGKAPRPG